MKDLQYDTDDCICALATPWGESALAVIRTTGQGCLEAFAKLFSRPQAILDAQPSTIHYGHFCTPAGQKLDEITAAVFRGTRSYTGQDSVEIFCHGSLPGVRAILDTLTQNGFRPAGPGEFTLRAFLNRKLDLTRAEAVAEIISAKSGQAQSLALNRLGGGIERVIETAKTKLLNLVSLLNIQLDYAEDDLEDQPMPFDLIHDVQTSLQNLAATYRAGRIYQEGVRVVLAGRTNAGKSSLFNLFLKEDRSIVSDEHGTTRDYLESWVSLAGIPVRLFDTAGLREADNLVEKEGIRRSEKIIEASQVILYIVDGSGGLTPEDTAFLTRLGPDNRLIKVWNKADLAPAAPQDWLALSAVSGQGFATLEQRLEAVILGGERPQAGVPVIDSLRQKQLLDRAVEALGNVRFGVEAGVPLDMVAVDVREALEALGEITGEVTTADILNNMFGSFCVGK